MWLLSIRWGDTRESILRCCIRLLCLCCVPLCLSSPGSVSGRLDYHRHNARQDRGHGGCAAKLPLFRVVSCRLSRACLGKPSFFRRKRNARNKRDIYSKQQRAALCVATPFLVSGHHQSVLVSGNVITSDFGDSLGYTDEPPSLRSTLRSALLSALLCCLLCCHAVLCCALLRSVVVRSHLLLLTFVVTSCHVRCDV